MNKQPQDFEKFLDQEGMEEFGWRLKEPESLKEIIVRAIESCRQELSKDLREGGTYNVRTAKGVIPMYFPDQSEVIVNSVKTLQDLIFFWYDDEATRKIGAIDKEISDAYGKYLDEYIKSEWVSSLRILAIKTKRIQIDTQGSRDRPKSLVGEVIEKELKYYILDLYRKMFRELILLYKRKQELSGKRTASIY